MFVSANGNDTLLPLVVVILNDVPFATAAKLPTTLVSFAVLRTIASNIPVDITPLTDVVAIGITALVPSEVIVLAPVVPVIPKLVDTLVALTSFNATLFSNLPIPTNIESVAPTAPPDDTLKLVSALPVTSVVLNWVSVAAIVISLVLDVKVIFDPCFNFLNSKSAPSFCLNTPTSVPLPEPTLEAVLDSPLAADKA